MILAAGAYAASCSLLVYGFQTNVVARGDRFGWLAAQVLAGLALAAVGAVRRR